MISEFDGDAFIITNNEVLLRNTKNSKTVIGEQNTVEKKVVTEKLLRDSNKRGFNNNVGTVTNKGTAMYDIISKFDKNSKEYNVMSSRLLCCQIFQQNVIDSIKGIIAKQMPKYWYSYSDIKIKKDDKGNVIDNYETQVWKNEQLKYCAIKKPYFFIYNYSHLMSKYKKFIKNCNINCGIRFGMNVDSLRKIENRTHEQEEFLKYYDLKMPVSIEKSTMNRICWHIENVFKDIKISNKEDIFDTSVLKSNNTYPKKLIKETMESLKQVYQQYCNELYEFNKSKVHSNTFMEIEELRNNKKIFVENYKKKIFSINNNEKMVCDCLIDLCYSNKNKQFVWDVCGDVIIKNLLQKNNYTIKIPQQDDSGGIEWNGYKFVLKEVKIKEEDVDCLV